ncbi:MAG: beta-lactamase family protein [Chloroflexi bacterium]|nr:beta-lactamase family protein [Chloroflexota bacterium]
MRNLVANRWGRDLLWDLMLPAMTFLFGLQLLRVLLVGVAGAAMTPTTLVLYGLMPTLVASLVLLVNRALGSKGTLAVTAGGLALARIADQGTFIPSVDLSIAIIGTTLFALFLPVYAFRLLGRGATAGGLFGLGVLLGFAGDTAIRGSLGLFDLSWRREGWVLATVLLLAGAQLAAVWQVVRREPPVPLVSVGSRTLATLTLPVGLVLVLEFLVFQNMGRQSVFTSWPQTALLAWIVLANAIGITIGTIVIAWRSAALLLVAVVGGLAIAALLAEQLAGLVNVFILVGQAGAGLTMALCGIALGSGVRLPKISWFMTLAGLGLLLAGIIPLYLRYAYGWNLQSPRPESAAIMAGGALIFALVAASVLAQHRSTGKPVWAPALIAFALLLLPGITWLTGDEPPARRAPTGMPVPAMASFDQVVTGLMERWQVPGGALAVVKDGRLVFARGYGLADVERNEPVQPDSLFRLASVSKPITSVTILKLVDEGRLDLDAEAFSLIGQFQPPTGNGEDPRIGDITVLQLLQHSGGWDRTRSFDPMFIPARAAREVGRQGPASCATVIRFMRGQRLSFDPGTRFAYSNFGYCALGRVVEQITGLPYQEYVKTQVLEPMGIKHMRIGSSLLEGRAEGEVRYYASLGAPSAWPVFPDAGQWVPRPYGSFYLEAMDSHGGWIGSPIDLMRFVTAVDGSRSTDFGRPKAVELAVSRPDPPLWMNSHSYYGMGWYVLPIGKEAMWWHSGSLGGTVSLLVRTHDGLAWAALFNSRPRGSERFLGELINGISQAADQVTEWPSHDLFEQAAFN